MTSHDRFDASARVDRLLQELCRKIAVHPNYADLLNLRGLARAFRGELDAAHNDFSNAVRVNPQYESALVNLCWVHVERDDPAAFRALVDGALTAHLSVERRMHLEFLGALRWETTPAALELLESEKAHATDAWLALDRLWGLIRASEWRHVDAQLVRIITANSALDQHFRAVGLLQKAGGRRQGLELWSSIYRGNPNLALLLRALALVPESPSAEAHDDELLHWSVTLSLDVCSFWLTRGAHLDLEGRIAEAEEALQRAQRFDVERVEPSIQLGVLYASQGRPEDAILELEKATARRPRFVDVRYLLGLAYEEVGRVDDAEKEFRDALRVNPDYTPAILALGSLLEAQSRDADAAPLLESVRSSGITSADLEGRLAGMYERLGQYAAAAEARARADALHANAQA